MTTTQPRRFLISADGVFLEQVAPTDLANYPGWTDCTDMDDEQFQRLVAERQAVRPYIVSVSI